MSISAGMVMKLRERTGAGMMECKKFLIATNGDIELAITEMRKAGQAKADKKADRIAAEGVVVIARAADAATAVMIEINSETDFVARDTHFATFTQQVAQTALQLGLTTIESLLKATLVDADITVEEARQALVAKVGENIQLRRIVVLKTSGVIGTYLHGQRIGVMVELLHGDEALAKDLAMHIAASRPLVVKREDVSQEMIATEREVFTAQVRDSGKPQDIIDKMVEGRINKFLDEVSLSGQSFVKDPSLKISALLKQKNAEVVRFIRFEVGEGIEKKEDNFVEEVMAQVREQ